MIDNSSKQLIENGIRIIKEDFNLEILKVYDNVSFFRRLFNSSYYKDKLDALKRKTNTTLHLLFESLIQKKEGEDYINNISNIKDDLEIFREDYIKQLININNDIPWLFSSDNIDRLSALYTRMEEVIDDIECAILEVKENLTSNTSKKEENEEEEITARKSIKNYHDDRNTRSFYNSDGDDEFLLTSALAFGAMALASEMNEEKVENSYNYDNEDNYSSSNCNEDSYQSSSSDYNDDSTRWGTNDYQSSSSSWYSDSSSYSDSGSSWSDSSSSYSDTSSW